MKILGKLLAIFVIVCLLVLGLLMLSGLTILIKWLLIITAFTLGIGALVYIIMNDF